MTTILDREVAVAPTDALRRVGTTTAMLLAPWGFVVANVGYAWATRDGGSDATGADSLTLAAAHPTPVRVGAIAAMLGCLLIVPATLGAIGFTRHRANRLGLIGGSLMIAGYVAYFGAVMRGLVDLAMAERGGPTGDYAAVLDAASEAAIPWLLLFVAGNLLGTLLLGIALLRARTVPAWAAAAICCWPVLHVTGLIAGTEWFEVAGATLQAVGFAALALRVARTG
ncbi:hypothetical protein ONA91_23570 [Micromonospora sp. DR5-3]|uniref:hypothetical protein n=1 Tax=unclassified Micromonospora TaxID=2617518 RepID=UPI0011DADF17|nr:MULTISPECIES: hypothetical protein [unclassified Micromonospora]MCW3817435.1 hypothetical protein [Micromonospora sp. DR5-3]TYC22891.1 hypothetical protein FXF52_18325 [Micromonospora sp. MP36]